MSQSCERMTMTTTRQWTVTWLQLLRLRLRRHFCPFYGRLLYLLLLLLLRMLMLRMLLLLPLLLLQMLLPLLVLLLLS